MGRPFKTLLEVTEQALKYLQGMYKIPEGGDIAVTPVIIVGTLGNDGIVHAGPSLTGRSIPGSADVLGIMSHSRKLNVVDQRWYDWIPEGRTVMEDRMQNAISWIQGAAGTIAYSSVRPYPGNPNVLNLLTSAGASTQANALWKTMRIADGFGDPDGPKNWFGVLFRMNDVNTAFIELGIQNDDAQRKMVGRVRLLLPSGQPQILDSAGNTKSLNDATTPSFGTWSRGGNAYALSTSTQWHWFGVEYLYQSGGASLKYVRIRLDDVTWDSGPYADAQNFGASTVNETLLEITTQNNAAVASSVDIGYVVLKDLVRVRGILG